MGTLALLLLAPRSHVLCLLRNHLLLLVLNLLQAIELLTIQLIQLGDNVRDCVFDARLHDVFDGVHATVCDLDHLIQCNEGRLPIGARVNARTNQKRAFKEGSSVACRHDLYLKRGEFDQLLERFEVVLA